MVEPTKQELEEIVKDSVVLSEVLKKLKVPENGRYRKKIKNLLSSYGIDTNHFSYEAYINKFQRKYKIVKKSCPVCSKEFEVKEGDPREKTTCSHGCSNTFFVDRRNTVHKIRRERGESKAYRTTCFKSWKKECVVCGFDKVVEVHHLDHNHSNNDKHNLVPVCPNHHQMLHTSKWAEETRQEILKVVESR
jgi:hypothetical protein